MQLTQPGRANFSARLPCRIQLACDGLALCGEARSPKHKPAKMFRTTLNPLASLELALFSKPLAPDAASEHGPPTQVTKLPKHAPQAA